MTDLSKTTCVIQLDGATFYTGTYKNKKNLFIWILQKIREQ